MRSRAGGGIGAAARRHGARGVDVQRGALGALFGLLATLWSAAAAAQAVPQRSVEVRWDSGAPQVSFSAVDLADDTVRRAINSGRRRTLLMRVYAYSESGQPIAVEVRACHVTYDIWQERYHVEYRSSRADEDEVFESAEEVIERCLSVRRAAIGSASDYRAHQGQRIYFGVLLEVNPIDPATVQRLRRWLSQPAGGGRVGNQAFFGSMVSLFVNRRIGSAERTARFRSQSVRTP